jgi:ribose transport system substrate-binding protein
MTTLRKTLSVAAAAVSVTMLAPLPASAQSKFACEPGDTYIMNVMVSAHP